MAAETVIDFEHDEAHAYCVGRLLRHQSSISQSILAMLPHFAIDIAKWQLWVRMVTWVRAMRASSQPKLRVIHILVINLKHTSMVAGPKIAQLTAMSIGPRFSSPLEGIISALFIAAAAANT